MINVDIASLAGLILGFVMLVFGIISSAGVGGFGEYLDPASAIITFGGAFTATLTSLSLQDYISGLKSFTLILKTPAVNASELIQKIIDLSNCLLYTSDAADEL